MKVLITGGSGFIGSALIRYLLEETSFSVINIDKLTYASCQKSLEEYNNHERYTFEQIDICHADAVRNIFQKYQPDAVMHLAAETHVDRSIDKPIEFIKTNILGTYNLLESSLDYYSQINQADRARFRFHHISTDEVFGSLNETDLFTETTPYDPRSPYSASKASSDHLVRAWFHTFSLPIIITNCSNNYGPYQFPEKLIPLMITKIISGEKLPIYGKGDQVRDWLFVDDHARALHLALTQGQIGESYNIGGNTQLTNLEVVRHICKALDECLPQSRFGSYEELLIFVADRPGHDKRYAMDTSKITKELGWKPQETFSTGLKKTVMWYMENKSWWKKIKTQVYSGKRLGVGMKNDN